MSDLGSIIGFDCAVEGSGTQGIFASCWHGSEGDPSSHAWKVFGGDGHGFAIRTTPGELKKCVTSIRSPGLEARFGEVQYIPACADITDPAFDVPAIQNGEAETRVVLELEDRNGSTKHLIAKMRQAAQNVCEGRTFHSPIEQLTFSSRADSHEDLAMLLPTDISTLFKEFVIGWKVPPDLRGEVTGALRKAKLRCDIRVLIEKP